MPTLYEKLATRPNLHKGWRKLNKNPRSHGLDGVTIKDFQQNLPANIQTIWKQLKQNTFEFLPPRGHLIDKSPDKKRPLKIPAVRDRVVCQGILNIIKKYFKGLNYKCSFAYIEERGREKALAEIIRLREKGFWYVLEADIKGFFDEVDQELLLEKIFNRLPDRTLDGLIRKSLASEIGNKTQFDHGELEYFPDGSVGIPQGGILSPLFANVYLSHFDKEMLEQRFKLVRYADDFVVLCKKSEEAKRAREFASNFLERNLKLKIHETKTKITNFGEGFDFLGITFNHQSMVPNRKTREKFEDKIREITSPKKLRNLIESLNKLKLTAVGWGHAYSFCHGENIKYGNSVMEKIYGKLNSVIEEGLQALLTYCDLLPKGKLRGFHYRVLGIPDMMKFLNSKPLIPLAEQNGRQPKQSTMQVGKQKQSIFRKSES